MYARGNMTKHNQGDVKSQNTGMASYFMCLLLCSSHVSSLKSFYKHLAIVKDSNDSIRLFSSDQGGGNTTTKGERIKDKISKLQQCLKQQMRSYEPQ